MPVAVSPLIPVVGEEAVVYDDFGLVVLCILPTALFARGIIGVDIDFVKVTEQAVFLELLFGNTEIGSYWGWTFSSCSGSSYLSERRIPDLLELAMA